MRGMNIIFLEEPKNQPKGKKKTGTKVQYQLVLYLSWITTPDKSQITEKLIDERAVSLCNKAGKFDIWPKPHHNFIPSQMAIELSAVGSYYSATTKHYPPFKTEKEFTQVAYDVYLRCQSIFTRFDDYDPQEALSKIKNSTTIQIPHELTIPGKSRHVTESIT